MLKSFIIAMTLLQSGKLIVNDVKVGSGPKAAVGDTMTVVYKGTLKSGKVFDQNEDKAPFVFVLGQGDVIKGWDQGLSGMKVGGKRHLVVPPDLGYGSRDMGVFPPNSTLNFDVQLLRIDDPKSTPKIQITDIKEGAGKVAKDGDSVNVLYTGTFLNGVKFDSSYDHKDASGKVQPLPVVLGKHGVVPGFEQGIVGMRVGGKRKVVIPYALGYGDRDNGPIPAKSTLVFTLELKSIG